eukprot:CAMPEP_0174718718 /NCGR_PEP_ID=MMETSP1094-20130205/29825_1 /TAXON_ID=156173 /ORGANISM="Chrysochromulina brevifilum, Strain UTEX LB 985" /LENGTH=158 /DNA_ID=CAMNT_0015918891 /DNA_START=176 /DNA_END=652 /DNA_ORIENTATION=-
MSNVMSGWPAEDSKDLGIPPPDKPDPAPYVGFRRPGPPPDPKAVEQKRADDVRKFESVMRTALFARTTAQFNEWRVLRKAFATFDHDQSGAIDLDEFIQSLEHLGLHVVDEGLPGLGGVPRDVVRALFARFDSDASGTIDYEEFCKYFQQSEVDHRHY